MLRSFSLPSVSPGPLLLGCALLLGTTACAPRIQDPGPGLSASAATEPGLVIDAPASDETSYATGKVITADGSELPLRVWLPEPDDKAGEDAQIKGAVLALHGFNDYANTFVKAGPGLAKRGIAVYAYDQRGFGATDQRGLWPGRDRLVDDALLALKAVKARHPDLPVGLMGVSMGGAVSMAALARAAKSDPEALPNGGAILVAPAVWGRETMPALYRGTLWFSAHTLPWLPVSGGDLGYWPSDDMDMMRALSGDPLMIRETRTDSVWGLTNLMDEALAASADLPGQVLLLYGLKDQIIPAPPVRRAAKRMGLAETNNAETLADKRMAIYPEGWHMLLRDKQAPVVLDDLAVWLTDKQAPLPSGADSRTEAFLSEALKSADERGEKLDPLTPWLEENNLRLRPKPPPGSED